MNENTPMYWLDMVEYDLESAKVMQKGGKYLYVGYICHLAAEKALKAAIAKNGTMPLKIHTLARLAEISGLKDNPMRASPTTQKPFREPGASPGSHYDRAAGSASENNAGDARAPRLGAALATSLASNNLLFCELLAPELLTNEQKSLLDALHPLNIEARYPAYKSKIAKILSREYCESLITRTEAFVLWIKQQL